MLKCLKMVVVLLGRRGRHDRDPMIQQCKEDGLLLLSHSVVISLGQQAALQLSLA